MMIDTYECTTCQFGQDGDVDESMLFLNQTCPPNLNVTLAVCQVSAMSD